MWPRYISVKACEVQKLQKDVSFFSNKPTRVFTLLLLMIPLSLIGTKPVLYCVCQNKGYKFAKYKSCSFKQREEGSQLWTVNLFRFSPRSETSLAGGQFKILSMILKGLYLNYTHMKEWAHCWMWSMNIFYSVLY